MYLATIIMKKVLLLLSLSLFLIVTHSCKKPPLPVMEEEMNTGEGNGSGGGTGTGEVEVSEFVGKWDYTKVDLTNGILEIDGPWRNGIDAKIGYSCTCFELQSGLV